MSALHDAQVALVPESDPELYPPVYPPQIAMLFAPFSSLPYLGALLAWIGITIALFAAIVWSGWRAVSRSLPDRVFVFIACAAFPPFWSLVLHGQMTIVVLAAFWAGWRALERGHRFVAGFAFAMLAVKPQFGLPLAVVSLACGEWWLIAGAVTSIAMQGVAVLLLLGAGAMSDYASFVPVMIRHADLLEPKPYQSHSLRTLTRIAPASADIVLWIAGCAVLLAIAVKAWKSAAPLRVRLGIVMLVSVLVNPHLIVYDAAVLVLPLMWLGAHLAQLGHRKYAHMYWTMVYWLFVLLLTPTAAVIGVQGSVFLMIGLLVLVHRTLSHSTMKVFVPAD
jgi:hypothetical protein